MGTSEERTSQMIELVDVARTFVAEGRRQMTLTRALDGVTMTIPSRQFVSIVGHTGCGKTTLLRLVAGLDKPDRGQVLVDGNPVQRPGPDRAIVFQHCGLYPWRTVSENVRFGLELGRHGPGGAADKVVEAHLELVGLTAFADHYPHELSGGMQQRVGLARALAVSPQIMLMDEPFGAVDALTRRQLGAEILRIWENDQRTVVFVTHSLDEALRLSDRCILMRAGRVIEDVMVDLPRPRDPDRVGEGRDYLQLRRRLWSLL